ncbi:transcription termination/antitermination protein NusA [Candidatus Poribacteria bacterium]|nr:transcription termination/antitermination protein NusA [Candidatus Poribacteria bacterium]MYB66493.1 transcription termination/antitermination protein NusA [Candidatus Poribacteria bacterium]MYF55489.1 transcription termination/antitermination protein NusA [Candidatus Poribacteria bacterium]
MKHKTEQKRESLQNSIRQMMGHTDLPEDVFVKAIEDALRVIALRHYGPEAKVSIDIQLEEEKIKCTVPKRVVNIMRDFSTEIPIEEAQKLEPEAQIGDTVEVEINPEEFGRIQAQLGRQILLGKLREAEREQVYNEFEGREGDIVIGYLQRYDGPNAIVDLERTDVLRAEALLPASQIPQTHRYNRGEAIRCLILDVKNEVTGEQIIVSRTHPDLITMLCEQEIPEVFEGQVRVMAVAREPGYRAKVAVVATEEGIDAVGTCVGVRGNRVRAMVQELKNEKIDFVDWNEDPTVYITNSLKPAKQIRRVELNEENMSAIVVVADEELSLAIGRRGQNARLVAKLTGWNIDIKSETEAPATLDNIFKNDADAPQDDNEEDTTDETTNRIEEEVQTEADTNVQVNSDPSDKTEDS